MAGNVDGFYEGRPEQGWYGLRFPGLFDVDADDVSGDQAHVQPRPGGSYEWRRLREDREGRLYVLLSKSEAAAWERAGHRAQRVGAGATPRSRYGGYRRNPGPMMSLPAGEFRQMVRAVWASPVAEQFRPTSAVVDWGTSMRGQGRRRGTMITGAMSAAPRGKKTYHDMLGGVPEPDRTDARETLGGQQAQTLYIKARSKGLSHDDAMDMAVRWEVEPFALAVASRQNPVSEIRANDTAKRVDILNHLIDHCGYSEADARKAVGKDRPGRAEARTALSPEQLETFERAVKREVRDVMMRTVLLMLVYTGMRVGEVTKLKWSQFHQPGGGRARIHVESHKGPKGYQSTIRPRDVPVTGRLEKVLNEYMDRIEKRMTHGRFPSSDEFVFPARTGNPITDQRVRNAIQRIIATEPSLRGLTPHVLRHTYATEVLRRCGNLAELQDALGHKSKVTTLVYLHGDGLNGDE